MESNTTTVTQQTPQEQALQKQKSSAEKKFEIVIAETTQVVASCKAIVITDSTTFGMANQILSKANNALKLAEEKRKEIIRPYQDFINFVNGFVKEKISNPLSEQVSEGKDKLRKWNEAELKKANELKLEDTKRFTFLKTCEANMQKQLDYAETKEQCDKVIEAINKQWPTDEKFGNYLPEANKIKAGFIHALTLKGKSIKAAQSNDVSAVIENIEQANEVLSEQAELSVVTSEKQEMIQESIVAEIGSVRRIWKFEVVAEDKLPREFLSVDPKKVKAYMDANKDKFDESGVIKGGIRFWRDAAPIIK